MNVDEDGKLCGDVDREWISNLIQKDKYSYDNLLITPVVGGVGKVTTTVLFAKLFGNAAEFFKNSAGDFQLPARLTPQPQEIQQPELVIQE